MAGYRVDAIMVLHQAEHPATIDNLFVTKEFSDRGSYTVRIFDGFERKWRRIVVDDMFPCHTSTHAPYVLQSAVCAGRVLAVCWPCAGRVLAVQGA